QYRRSDGYERVPARLGCGRRRRRCRACDTAIFAALPAVAGFPIGPAQHMAKIIECASLCCVPCGRDSILATLDQEGCELESRALHRRGTPVSVAAHSLYEQSDPFTVQEPEGIRWVHGGAEGKSAGGAAS